MTLDSRDQSIITQVAAKIASDLAVAAGSDNQVGPLVSAWAEALPLVAGALFEQIVGKQAETVFPGSTEGWQPADFNAGNVTPITAAPSYVPQQAPAPIPGVTDGDPAVAALWLNLQANPSNWTDCRATKPSAKHPDFKSKVQKDAAGKYFVSLYLDDKKNPSWVPQLVANLRF